MVKDIKETMADFKKRLQETNTDSLIGLSTGFKSLMILLVDL